MPVVGPALVESSAWGIAGLAGLVAGVWSDRDEIEQLRPAGHRFEPRMPPAERDRLVALWRRGVERARAWMRGSA